LEGLEQLQLSVVRSPAAAHRFYLAHGFTPFGEEKRALKIGSSYLDEDHMVLHLSDLP
jgi:hypothetical protein